MKKIFVLVFGSWSISAAGVPVIFPGKIDNFLQEVGAKRLSTHRSGLLANLQEQGANRASDTALRLKVLSDLEEWNSGKCRSYLVESDTGQLLELSRRLSGRIQNSGYFHQRLTNNGKDLELLSKDNNDTLRKYVHNNFDRNFDFLRDLSWFRQVGEEVLSDLTESIEYDNHEITHLNGVQTTLDLRFRRIFKGGLIRGNISFVYLSFGQDGRLLKVWVRWPTFKSEPISESLIRRDIDSVRQGLGAYFAGIPEVSGSANKIKKPLRATIQGASLAWLPEEFEGGTRISPGYSFVAEVEYEDGVKIYPYSDAPYYK